MNRGRGAPRANTQVMACILDAVWCSCVNESCLCGPKSSQACAQQLSASDLSSALLLSADVRKGKSTNIIYWRRSDVCVCLQSREPVICHCACFTSYLLNLKLAETNIESGFEGALCGSYVRTVSVSAPISVRGARSGGLCAKILSVEFEKTKATFSLRIWMHLRHQIPETRGWGCAMPH